MSERALRRARVARGLVVSASGAVLALGAHLLAGGALVSPAVLLLLACAAAGCTLASDQRWSLPRLLVALSSIQVGVHVAMAVQMSDGAAAQEAAAGASHSPWVMLAAHAAAVLSTAWLLRNGDAVFWRLVERLRPPVLWPAAPAAALADPAWLPPRPRAAAILRVLAGALARRGPPTLTPT